MNKFPPRLNNPLRRNTSVKTINFLHFVYPKQLTMVIAKQLFFAKRLMNSSLGYVLAVLLYRVITYRNNEAVMQLCEKKIFVLRLRER